ncbi:sporulation protein YtxC [Aquibacillus albus]|uniref:Sporulation protein YtxC n=1 Tax=Aquibacillus albus TaxID=1168171 RepID=A0ABS2N1F8_9BACI|nr:sporulation protein YtxC [Aquibacillus albus]MBM7571960.1 putative sporulation protein YtxC [Aquibacillus albus]
MLEVYFEIKKEAETFCERLLLYDPHVKIKWNTDQSWGNQLKLTTSKSSTYQQYRFIAKAMTDVFIFHRELNWVTEVITKVYYFSNKDEIQRIVDITHSIISGEDVELVQFIKKNKPRDTLLQIFELGSREDIIHFNSIVNFRMQLFQSELIEVVGLAIDEFKREEEYQSFVHSLREYIAKRKTKVSIVHLLQGDNFIFYKSNGEVYTTMELKSLISKEPLYIVGLDQDEVNLTPLLAMAPEKIIIYGDSPSEAKTLTVLNIFQEKVCLKPMKSFPFEKSLNSNG